MPSALHSATFFASDAKRLKEQALAWAQQFRQVAFFDSNKVDYPHEGFRCLLGVSDEPIPGPAGKKMPFKWLEEILDEQQENQLPLFGYLAYDLKNHIEHLESNHPDNLGWPELHFFAPEIWFEFGEGNITIHSRTTPPKTVWQEILATTPTSGQSPIVNWQQRVSREQYLADVQAIRQHIEEGDVYELNYCQEFYAQVPDLDVLPVFRKLMELSPMPFSGFMKLGEKFLLCASPERYLKKEGNRILSQPIKGTSRRGTTPAEDAQNKHDLLHSEKERAENMMIVDLVRNDLSRCCQIGSVKVDELFGIYSFPFVHQMISTISGEPKPGVTLPDILQASFPMGSMTGAPKVRAMQLIEQYEKVRRGLFSGSFGYLLPDGTFDLNVVIRSLQYNRQTGYLSYSVGSAITYDSVPEQEYEECLLKAAAIRKALQV